MNQRNSSPPLRRYIVQFVIQSSKFVFRPFAILVCLPSGPSVSVRHVSRGAELKQHQVYRKLLSKFPRI
jgi:hypothetical protein